MSSCTSSKLPRSIAVVAAAPRPPRSSGEAESMLEEVEEAWFVDAETGEEVAPCALLDEVLLNERVAAIVFAPTVEKGYEALKKGKLRYLGEWEGCSLYVAAVDW